MLNKKGQGTIEYLVIIAIVIVIALVVVGLLLQVMNQGGEVPEQTARIAWQSGSPWAIIDWTGTTDGNLLVVLKNNSYETLTFVGMVVAGDTNFPGTAVNVAPGATLVRIIDLSATNTFTTGQGYSFRKDGNNYIVYNTTTLTGKKQFAAADIIGTAP